MELVVVTDVIGWPGAEYWTPYRIKEEDVRLIKIALFVRIWMPRTSLYINANTNVEQTFCRLPVYKRWRE